MKVTFKSTDETDIDALVQFVREFHEFDHLPFDESVTRDALQTLLSNDSYGRVWLIQYAEQAIGYVVLTFGFSLEARGRDALVDELYVRENYRGQGVGKTTLNFLENFCRSQEIYRFYLEVERANTAAQGFYHKHGFTDNDRYLLSKLLDA